MAVSPDNYFAFADILLYEIVGDIWLFIIIGLLLIIILCARYMIPMQTTIIIGLLWLLVCTGLVYNYIVYAFAVAAIGFISYYLYSKTFKRG